MKESIGLAAAFAKAQAGFGPIYRDKTVTVRMKSGGSYTFSYAPLETILHAVMPALNLNGLSLSQAPVLEGEREYLETILRHESGQISNRVPVLLNESGPQAYGSALTYARRYGITTLLCISADDDDDGNGAEGNETTIQRQPAPPSESAKQSAQKFVDAMNTGIESAVWDFHAELTKNHERYEAAWRLLDSKTRTQLKKIIAARPNAPEKKAA